MVIRGVYWKLNYEIGILFAANELTVGKDQNVRVTFFSIMESFSAPLLDRKTVPS
jgi:hypothetical protein